MPYDDILNNLKETPPRALNDHILLIDGMNTLIRSFSLLKAMNPTGTHVGGLVGFLRSLGYVTRIFDPTRVVVVWDGKGGSGNRKNIDPNYKAQRATSRITHWGLYDTKEEETEALIGQLYRVQDYLECLPVQQIMMEKLEADDIMAYLAKRASKAGKKVTTLDITGDVDINGLVTISSATQFEDINIAGNVITTTNSNSNLELRANGTGEVLIPNNDVEVTQNLTVDGTLSVGNIVSTGTITANNFTTGDILIDDNFITTTTSNSDLELRANGTGSIIIDQIDINGATISSSSDIVLDPGSENVIIDSTGSLKLPVGSTGERPTAITGQIRFNNTLGRFEGYNGSNWIQLSGVVDLDGDTKVTAELTEGANDNTIRFDVSGSTVVDIDSDRLSAPKVVVDDVTIDGNVISSVTDTDLELTAQGTGSVVIDNFSIKDNVITNTVANSVTTFENTSSGYVKIDGTYGFVIPVGGNTQRPPLAYTETGQMRFNTDGSRVEIYDGSNWVSVAGSASGISRADAEDLAFEIVLSLG